MSDGLRRLPPKFLTDSEQFHGSGIESPLGLRDYWRWSASSLMDNTARGLVAEFLVATALKTYIPDRPRVEWDPYDFEAEIDVKWNPETGKYSNEPCRADLYVFCALVEKKVRDQAAVLNTDKWRFRVVPKEELPDQETITWSRLEQGEFGYEHLRQRIVEEARWRQSS